MDITDTDCLVLKTLTDECFMMEFDDDRPNMEYMVPGDPYWRSEMNHETLSVDVRISPPFETLSHFVTGE